MKGASDASPRWTSFSTSVSTSKPIGKGKWRKVKEILTTLAWPFNEKASGNFAQNVTTQDCFVFPINASATKSFTRARVHDLNYKLVLKIYHFSNITRRCEDRGLLGVSFFNRDERQIMDRRACFRHDRGPARSKAARIWGAR